MLQLVTTCTSGRPATFGCRVKQAAPALPQQHQQRQPQQPETEAGDRQVSGVDALAMLQDLQGTPVGRLLTISLPQAPS